MNARHTVRRFAALAFVMALFALSASSTFAQSCDTFDPEYIIIVGG
jgi:hypothetical protein